MLFSSFCDFSVHVLVHTRENRLDTISSYYLATYDYPFFLVLIFTLVLENTETPGCIHGEVHSISAPSCFSNNRHMRIYARRRRDTFDGLIGQRKCHPITQQPVKPVCRP